MAKSEALNQPQKANNAGVTFTNADAAGTIKTLMVAGTDDTLVQGINVVSDDATARVIDLLVTVGGTDYMLGAVAVPASSGSNGAVAGVDMMNASVIPSLLVGSGGKRVMLIKAGTTLKVRNQTQVASGKTMTIIAFAQDY